MFRLYIRDLVTILANQLLELFEFILFGQLLGFVVNLRQFLHGILSWVEPFCIPDGREQLDSEQLLFGYFTLKSLFGQQALELFSPFSLLVLLHLLASYIYEMKLQMIGSEFVSEVKISDLRVGSMEGPHQCRYLGLNWRLTPPLCTSRRP